MRTKTQTTWGLPYKHRLCKRYEVYKDYIEVQHRTGRKHKKPKNSAENAGFYKSRMEKNNDHTRIIREIQYRCSFNKTMIGK